MQRIELETDPLLLDLLSSRSLITVPSLWASGDGTLHQTALEWSFKIHQLSQEFDDYAQVHVHQISIGYPIL